MRRLRIHGLRKLSRLQGPWSPQQQSRVERSSVSGLGLPLQRAFLEWACGLGNSTAELRTRDLSERNFRKTESVNPE